MELQTEGIKRIKLTCGHHRPLLRQATSIIHPPKNIRLYIIMGSKEMQAEKYIEVSQQHMLLKE